MQFSIDPCSNWTILLIMRQYVAGHRDDYGKNCQVKKIDLRQGTTISALAQSHKIN